VEDSSEYTSYRFFSYMRSGWGTRFSLAEDQTRADVELDAELLCSTGSGDEHVDITGRGRLHGPGDALGIKEEAVLRTTPRANVGDYNPNCLASIEFSHPELPWLLSTATPEGSAQEGIGLRPWFCLIVLEPNEYKMNSSGRVPSIVVLPDPDGQLPLPDLNQAWAWAHVQVTDLSDEERQQELRDIVEQQPERVFSRLLCARRLRANASYRAFVVPTFETGRCAGLGEPQTGVNALDLAWSDDGDNSDDGLPLPYYHSWSFGTGPRGDFEYQVGLLQPQRLPADAGTQPFDTNRPGSLVRSPILPDGPLRLAGALVSPRWEPKLWPVAKDPFVGDMRRMIHAALTSGTTEHEEDQDPWLVPPVYGRWHAMLEGSSHHPPWPWQLNTDPRHRAIAGLATRIVQKHQEDLMASAWAQAGDIEEANQALRPARQGAGCGEHG
jgi:hypothetical protein